MKQLNIDRINAKAPYKVSMDGKQLVFDRPLQPALLMSSSPITTM